MVLEMQAAKGSVVLKKRVIWIDWARALAILAVVLCHSTEAIYGLNVNAVVDNVGDMTLSSQITAFCLFTTGRLGVPLFLFMSGYLMLDRSYDKDACLGFWKTKWLGLLVATEVWLVLYDLFFCWTNSAFSLIGLIKNMLFWSLLRWGICGTCR